LPVCAAYELWTGYEESEGSEMTTTQLTFYTGMFFLALLGGAIGLFASIEGGEKEMKTSDFEAGYLAGRVEQQVIIDEQVRKIEMLREALEKISLFCPPDTTVDQLDESPDMAIRLHNAEIGDTARCALAATKEMK